MESLDDDDDFLAGLAPPSIKLAANSPSAATADDALQKTPNIGAATARSVLGRKADATSTLLNFLKQEQAVVPEQLPKPANLQPQRPVKDSASNSEDGISSSPTSTATALTGTAGRRGASDAPAGNSSSGPARGAGTSPTRTGSDIPPPPPAAPVTAASHSSPVSSAAAAHADSPVSRVSALRQQLEAKGSFSPASATTGRRAATTGASRAAAPVVAAPARTAVKHLDSWDLDDDLLPDGSEGKPAAAIGGNARSASNADDGDDGGSTYMPSFGRTSSKNASSRSRTGPPDPSASAAAGTSWQSSAKEATDSKTERLNRPAASAASNTQLEQQQDDEKQQVASQMAAALARRAQLNQQQHPRPSAGGGDSTASNSPAARAVGSPAVTTSDMAYQTSSPLAAAATPTRFGAAVGAAAATPAAGPAGVFSIISNPAYSPTVSPQITDAGVADSSATAPAVSKVLSFGGGGSLLARGLADLGIVDIPSVVGLAAAGQASSTSSNGAAAGWRLSAAMSEHPPFSSLGLPPSVMPLTAAVPPGVTPMAGRTAAAAAGALRADAPPVSSSDSAAAAAAILSTLTTSGNGRRAQGNTPAQQDLQAPPTQADWQPAQQPALQLQQRQPERPAAEAVLPAPVVAGVDLDTQLNAVRQLASLHDELADQKLIIARLRQQAEEGHNRHQVEMTRLRSDLEAAHQKAQTDAAAARDNMGKEVAAAEARAQRAACLERDVALAQLQAQAAAIAQEREALAAQRMNTEVLTDLSEKVRDAAAVTAERESRALAALERSSAERNVFLVARERRLQEREEMICARERELDELKSQLSKVLAGLEDQAVADKGLLEAQTARLARESARLEALQSILLSERQETKLALTLEKQALEEARAARVKEREALVAEMTSERRRLAEEAASTARAAEEARANLLDLKGRVADYEAAAAAALRQTREEEARAAAVTAALKDEHAKLAAAEKDLKAASHRLDDDRSQLQEWGARLARLTREFDAAKEEVKSARTEIQTQRITLANQVAALISAQEQLEVQRQVILNARVDLDRQRVLIAEERAALAQDRITASQSATAGRPQTAAAVFGTQQIAVMSPGKYRMPARPQTSPAMLDHATAVVSRGLEEQLEQPRNGSGSRRIPGLGKNSLRKLLEELQADQSGDQGAMGSRRDSKSLSSTVKAQRDFLDQLKAASAAGSWNGALSGLDSRHLAVDRLSGSGGLGNFSGVTGIQGLALSRLFQQHSSANFVPAANGWGMSTSNAAAPLSPGLLQSVAGAGAATALSQQDAMLVLQQLAQLQQATDGQVKAMQGDAACRAAKPSRRGSRQQQGQAGDLIQQQHRQPKASRRHRQHNRSSMHRVSSELSQMIALTGSGSSDVEAIEDLSSLEELQGMHHLSGS